MEVYVSIFEVLLATHLHSRQTTRESRTSRFFSTAPPQYQNRHRYTGIPSFAKLTIVKFPFGRFVLMSRSDSILLWFRWILGPNCVVFTVLGVRFVVLGDQKLPHELELGSLAANHHISTVSLPGYIMRSRNDDMFRGFPVENCRLVSIAMLRGGRV